MKKLVATFIILAIVSIVVIIIINKDDASVQEIDIYDNDTTMSVYSQATENPLATVKSKEYENLQMLLNDTTLKAGDKINVLGYYQKQDGGSGDYNIVSSKSLMDNGFTVHRMKNGLFAVLEVKDGTLNAMAAGISPGKEVSEQLNKLIDLMSGQVDSIMFREGRYYFQRPVELKTGKYIGAGNVEFAITQDFESPSNKVFFTQNESGGTLDVSISNITFLAEVSQSFVRKNQETVLMCVTGTDKIDIDNCKFIARQAKQNGAFGMIDLLWFRDSNFDNISITNSEFENLTCQDTGSVYKGGGAIWLWGGEGMASNTISNVEISGCTFRHTSSDEVIAIWGCVARDISINSCEFTVEKHHSDNVIAFNDMQFQDVTIRECDFNINATCLYVIKAMNDLKAELSVTKCNFNLKNGIKSPWDNNVSLFYLINEKTATESTAQCMQRALYHITDCKVNSTGDTQYRAMVTAQDVDVNMTGCNIIADFSNGLLWLEKGFAHFDLTKSYIDLKNSNIAYIKSTTQNCLINLLNNTIEPGVTLSAENGAIFQYTVKNNKINCRKKSSILRCVGTAYKKSTMVLNFTGNSVTNDEKLSQITVE